MSPKLRNHCPIVRNGEIVDLLLLTIFSNFAGGALAPAPSRPECFDDYQSPPSGAAEQEKNLPPGESDNPDPWLSLDTEKRKLNLMLAASIAIVAGFFFVVLMISLLRMGRHYRQRTKLSKKSQPTDYSDAWSQYRLKEGWEKELPDD